MDLDALKAAGIAAALAGGEVARQGFGRPMQVRTKSSPTDLVTEYDRRAQEAIVAHLRGRFPDHGLLGEEGLSQSEDAEWLWVIDPIDGTTNYAHGIPIYAVSLGLAHRGVPQAGVVYAPSMDELFVACRGRGATCNGEPIAVSRTAQLAQAVLATGFSYQREKVEVNLAHFGRFVRRARAIRRIGSAALDLCWVAMGRLDGYWELDLQAWDIAAGRLIVEEAGGRASDFSGAGFGLRTDTLLSTNGVIHEEMVAVLEEA